MLRIAAVDGQSGVDTVEYSFDLNSWFTGNSVAVNGNIPVYIRVTDAVGNVTEETVIVDKIDTEAPELTITGNPETWTGNAVTLRIAAVDGQSGIGQIEYSFDQDSWFTGSTVAVSSNTAVYVRATDAAGNVTEETVIVDKIDTEAPELTITGNPETWTGNAVMLRIAAVDGQSGIGQIEYSFDQDSWFTGSTVAVSSNTAVYVRATDAAGNVTEETVIVDKIDTEAPELTITGNPETWTTNGAILRAEAADGQSGIRKIEYSFGDGEWITGSSVEVESNCTVTFRVTDHAGNESTSAVTVGTIDKEAPVLTVSGNAAEWTSGNVLLKAAAVDTVSGIRVIEYSFDDQIWTAGTSVLVQSNQSVYFRAVDEAGNVSVETVQVSKIDREAPVRAVELSESFDENGNIQLHWEAVADRGISGISGYQVRWGTTSILAGDGFFGLDNSFSLSDLQTGTYFWQVRSVDNAGNVSDWSEVKSFVTRSAAITGLSGDASGISWDKMFGCSGYAVQYSTDGFDHILYLETEGSAVDTYNLPEGEYQWQVSSSDCPNWTEADTSIHSPAPENDEAVHFVSDADGCLDVFFTGSSGQWGREYGAQHVGMGSSWAGTGEMVRLNGKNKLTHVFEGSADTGILVATDDANGDALFVDDIYTALGDQARVSRINEIRAGSGDDIVDMTSQRFTCISSGVKIYGGLGNDTLWANNGNNILFGDAGNDRLVGGVDNDVFIGGAGDDSMHGGGGSDIFCFGGDWGNDTVEQLSGGNVTLWFEEGSESNWDLLSRTYTDGANSVRVSGTAEVILKFGSDASLPEGCFDEAASEKIFEDKNKGILA